MVAIYFFGGVWVCLLFFYVLVLPLLQGLFPCHSHGPVFHSVRRVGEGIECERCGVSWRLKGKVYSILSDGDPNSYIPIWERVH